jgi:hypothetical protein
MITDKQILKFINNNSFRNIKDVSPKLKEIIIEILTNKNK